jgi:Plant transposon protein
MDFPTIDENYVTDWIASIDGMIFAANLCKKSATTVPLKRKRAKRVRREDFDDIDYSKTTWGLLIRNPLVKFPDNHLGKTFRRRFRVPFQLFEILVKICSDNNVFAIKNLSRVKIPIEIKLLCCLRVLGRDDCCDAIEEYSAVPEKTVWWFFKIFLKNFPRVLFKDVIRLPREGVELEKVMNVYRKMGFPGAVGSVDATHIRWHMCPVEFVHAATGKEKYPSVAFQVCIKSDGFDPTTLMLRRLALYRSCDQCFLCTSEK